MIYNLLQYTCLAQVMITAQFDYLLFVWTCLYFIWIVPETYDRLLGFRRHRLICFRHHRLFCGNEYWLFLFRWYNGWCILLTIKLFIHFFIVQFRFVKLQFFFQSIFFLLKAVIIFFLLFKKVHHLQYLFRINIILAKNIHEIRQRNFCDI